MLYNATQVPYTCQVITFIVNQITDFLKLFHFFVHINQHQFEVHLVALLSDLVPASHGRKKDSRFSQGCHEDWR